MSDDSFPYTPQEPANQPGLGKEVASFFWETIKIVVISLIIILPIRYFIVQPFFVKGASMESNFEDGDYIFVNELAYEVGQPHRGDVIIFRYPLDTTQFFIKRVIGLPGETVDIKNNSVTIYNATHPNGVTLSEPYLDPGQETQGTIHLKLSDNEYFVMGDNRLKSSDSRRWGPVNRALIIGEAYIRLWPFSRVAKIPHPTYPI